MNRTLALTALLFTMACSGGDDPTNTDSTAPTDTTSCNTIDSNFPADGAQNIYYRPTLTWEFSEADTSAAVTVTDAGGATVAGSGEWLGDVYLWNPTSPLMPSTTYTATMSFCDGAQTPSTTFTTSLVGAPISVDIVGNTYALDAGVGGSAQFIEPPGVGGLLQTAFDDFDINILVGVIGNTGGQLELLGAVGTDAPITQNNCFPSIDFPQASFAADPYFNVGPQDAVFAIAGSNFTLQDLNVNGAFAPDGSLIAGAAISATLDTREALPILNNPNATDDAICALAEPFGVFCEACEGGGDFCLSALITNITADQVNNLTLVEISEAQADINCPPAQ